MNWAKTIKKYRDKTIKSIIAVNQALMFFCYIG